MPIWGAFFLLRLHRIPFLWVDFARHGEFGLYAAAFLAPAVYQILKNIRRDKFPLKGGAVLLAVAGILMAGFLYAGTNPQFGATPASSQATHVDEIYLVKVSGGLLACAFIFSFLVMLIENVTTDPDLGLADKVNQGFLNAAASLDGPLAVSQIADLSQLDLDDPIPSDEDLGTKFDAKRAEDGAGGN